MPILWTDDEDYSFGVTMQDGYSLIIDAPSALEALEQAETKLSMLGTPHGRALHAESLSKEEAEYWPEAPPSQRGRDAEEEAFDRWKESA
jgi:hypothetical protein